MAAHFVRRQLPPNFRSPMIPRAPASLHHRAIRPATQVIPQTNNVQLHVTPAELTILVAAVGVLIALLCWLAYIILEYTVHLIRDTLDEFNMRKRSQREAQHREHQVEDGAKWLENAGLHVDNTVKSIMGPFDGGSYWERGDHQRDDCEKNCREWKSRQSNNCQEKAERRALLEEHRTSYRCPDVYLHRALGHKASDSSSSAMMTGIHRDDCEGQCGMKPRRRSGDVEEGVW